MSMHRIGLQQMLNFVHVTDRRMHAWTDGQTENFVYTQGLKNLNFVY